MRKCYECPDQATQQVEVKTILGMKVLDLCAAHADGHRKAEAWSRVIDEMREAENAGNYDLAEKLDREQIELLKDREEFSEFILID